ncbi:unnamed protein product [Coffea canephora]|uniref:Uncharacterized protein n=1 Tax=Coffea canephora TaxID=49390 RepID=A0A068U0G0_COFCA|nr:unnamed protein product [Coffea canephora]
MEMIMGSRSCRIRRLCSSSSSSSSWKRVERSKGLLLASELASSSDVARLTGYERLSQSTGLPNEYGGGCKPISITRKHTAAWRYLGKVFSFKRTGGRGEVAAEAAANPPEAVVKKKNRSSWLPDRDRRWPVQGW